MVIAGGGRGRRAGLTLRLRGRWRDPASAGGAQAAWRCLYCHVGSVRACMGCRTTRAWHFTRSVPAHDRPGIRAACLLGSLACSPWTTLAPGGASKKSNKHSKRARGSGQGARVQTGCRASREAPAGPASCVVGGCCGCCSCEAWVAHHMKSSRSPSPAAELGRQPRMRDVNRGGPAQSVATASRSLA